MSACHVNIIGRLTADPEAKVPASGASYTRLRLAWNARKDEPGYIDATLFGKSGEIAAKYLTKGSQLSIMGARLEWRQYEKEGEATKRTAYSLVGGDLILLGSKNDAEQASPKVSTDDDIPF
jgi:single-strand DNA-binding protein